MNQSEIETAAMDFISAAKNLATVTAYDQRSRTFNMRLQQGIALFHSAAIDAIDAMAMGSAFFPVKVKGDE